MKFKKLFMTLGLALGLGVGAVAGIASTKEVLKADASFSGGEYVYLQPNSDWTSAGARFAFAYITTDDSNTYWADLSLYDSSLGIYEGVIPEGTWGKLIFTRMNPSVSANNWDNKWNQTGDLTSLDNEFYVITGWDNSGNWSGPYYGSRNFNWQIVFEDGVTSPIALSWENDGTGQAAYKGALPANKPFRVERVEDSTVYRDYENKETGDTDAFSKGYFEKDSDSNYIVANTAGEYEIYVKPNGVLWTQVSSTVEATAFATTFLTETSKVCKDSSLGAGDTDISSLEAIWNAADDGEDQLEELWGELTGGAKAVFATGTANDTVAAAKARYVVIMGRYADTLNAFSGGPSYSAVINEPFTVQNSESNMAIWVIVGASLIAVFASGAFIILRKRKQQF